MDKHSDAVNAALANLKAVESRILDIGMLLMKSAEGHIYAFDLFALATLNRAVAISSAFHTLVNDFNMVAAGALVRIHLDTALRYHASHLVDDWNEFAESVVRGERIDKMKDRNGKKLTDSHLSSEFEQHMPGARSLYDRACSYVHFSHVHTASVFDGRVDREQKMVGIKVGATDRELSENYYVDACNTFSEISEMIIDLVQSWIDYKEERYAKHGAEAT